MLRFCTCYSEYIATVVTDEEIAAGDVARTVSPGVAAKAQEAIKVCLPKARRQ